MKARVRGIYATALTEALLDAGHEVVGASTPIRRRFDAEPSAPPDARIATTEDRQGVGAHGDPDAIGTLRGLLTDTGLDALAWTDPDPPGTVCDGTVTETLGGGAVVRLRVGGGESEGDATTEGYLPYGSVDDRIETGDPVRVQVRESAAPWTDRRPELDGSLRAGGGLVTLEPGSGTRVDARNDKDARELSGMLDLLGLPPGVARRLEAARGRRRHRGAAGRTRPGGRGRRGAGRRRRRGGGRRRSRRFGQRARGAVDAPERRRLGVVRPREPVRARRRPPTRDRDDAGSPPGEGGVGGRIFGR